MRVHFIRSAKRRNDVLEELYRLLGERGSPVTPAGWRLAATCRRRFGLDLYGIDCIPDAAGPVVIEVNEFPNYTGVPAASEHLAEFVVQRALRLAEERR